MDQDRRTISLLNLSIDSKLFDEGSAVAERFIEFGKFFKEVHVVVYTKPGFVEKQIAENVFLYPTNTQMWLGYFMSAWRIASGILARHSANQLFAITSQEAFTHIVGAALKKKFGCKLQLQYHTDFQSPFFRAESLKNYARYVLYNYTLRFADAVRVVSRRIKQSIGARIVIPVEVQPLFISLKKGEVPDAAVVPENVSSKKYPQFDFVFLMASRLEREKNIEMAIDAFAQVIKVNPRAGLVIVGSGSKAEFLKAKTLTSHVSDNVIFESWANNLGEYYKSADVFLLSSNYEGYGLTLIEAAASGVPIVTTDVGLVGDVLCNEVDVLVSPVGEAESFAQQMTRMMQDRELRARLAQHAWNKARAQMGSFEAYAQRTFELIENMVHSRI